MVADPGAKVRPHRLRPLAGPREIRVEVGDGGHPARVPFEGAMRDVVTIQDRWRIDDEWWRDSAISRMYYEMLLDGGRVMTVYLDLLEGTWWMQRY